MNKKLLISLFLILSYTNIHAENVSPFPAETNGIQIIPLSNLNIPNELKAETRRKQAEENLKGYQEDTDSDEYIRFLTHLRSHSLQEIKDSKKLNDPYDTHLKSSLSEINLSIPFKPVKSIKNENVIGYAAIGSYIDNKGWSGVKEFFDDPELGTCAYSVTTIKAAQLSKETTEYLVHKKPSNKIIEGNFNTGFIYNLNWYTNHTMSVLDCANKKFDPAIMSKMIIYANKVDIE